MNYPECKKTDFTEDYFGHTLADPYYWLKNAQDKEVLAWVAEENAFTNQWFDQEEVKEKAAALKAAKPKEPFQIIHPWGDDYAASRMEDGSYCLYRLDENLANPERLMDKNTLAHYTPYQILPCPSNPDYIILSGAYDGDAMMTPLVVNCREKKILKKIQNVFYPTWSPKGTVVYYPEAVADYETNTSQIHVKAYHAETGEETTILQDTGIIGEIHSSSDESCMLIELWLDYTVSCFYSLNVSTGVLTDITKGRAVQMKYADTIKGVHYFVSKETSPTGEILSIPDGQTLAEAQTVLPSGSATLDMGFAIGGKLFVLMTENACYKLAFFYNGKMHEISLPDKMGTVTFSGRSKNAVFLRFESFTAKPMLLSFDGETAKPIWKSSNETHPNIVVEQLTAASKGDGTAIPYFLVRRRDAERNGNTSTSMYAYGGYNSSMYPWSYDMVTGLDVADWVEKGGIYVLANIRGGAEFGTKWHEEGMLLKKRNCYDDFIAVAEQLIKDGWTAPEKLAIDGCSNGGLLMSALVTMRPDLFGCVIDSVPHTDMIHFAEDDRGPMYVTEYGNPRENEEMFQYLLSYSPYHNVKPAAYPPVYIQTGECDNNVPPYHGKKFAARMQNMTIGDAPILLRVLAKGAHDRGSGEVYWKTIAEMQLFIEKALGL